jgi:hypothetical protein
MSQSQLGQALLKDGLCQCLPDVSGGDADVASCEFAALELVLRMPVRRASSAPGYSWPERPFRIALF